MNEKKKVIVCTLKRQKNKIKRENQRKKYSIDKKFTNSQNKNLMMKKMQRNRQSSLNEKRFVIQRLPKNVAQDEFGMKDDCKLKDN
jgi:hypothetical protein